MGGIAFQAAKKKLVDGDFIRRLDAPALRAVLALPGVDVSSIKVGPPPRTPRHTRVPPPQFLACICCRGRAWFACQGRPRPPFPPRRCVKHPGLCVLYVSHVCGRISASAGNLVSVSHIFAITPRRPIGSAHLSEVHVRSPAARRPVGVSVAKTTHTHTATNGRLRRLTLAAWRRTAPLLVSLRPVLPAASLCCALLALLPAFAPG